MRRIIFVLICFWGFAASAQYIDMQTGFSFASGSFGNNNLAKDEDGFAQSGSTFGLQVNYLIHKKIGICGKVNYSTFGIDESSYQKQLNERSSPGITVVAQSNGNYKSTSALAGAYITLGKQNFTFDIRLMAGFLSLNNQGFTYTTTYTGQAYSQTTAKESDASIAFGWGLTGKYALPKDFYLSFNLDNIYANTEFNRGGYNSSSEDKMTRPYEAYLLTLGIGYAIQ